MDWLEILRTAFPIIATLVSVGVFIFMLMAKDKFLSKRDGEKFTHEIDGLKNRLISAEAELRNVPRGEAIHELAISIERMNGNIKGISAQLVSLEKFSKLNTATMERQEQFLLNEKSGK